MGKVRVADFDQDVCSGDHPDVAGECPYRREAGADTGRSFVDRLADAETSVLEALKGDKQYKCGACGCPLANLGATDYAPDNCPRLRLHDRV